jgi:hypothetical protein
MTTGDIKSIFILLVDISGYTRFIRFHKISLLHAEKIIAELMESILHQVEVPVIAHEILGDAISFYAIDEGTPDQADKIYAQLQNYFDAFRDKEASLISSCGLCRCDACKQVGKLRLKAILHHGQVAFTKVQNMRKISGEDVILSHRLLKNSLDAKEYILMTRTFADLCQDLKREDLVRHHEHYNDVGPVDLYVKTFGHEPVTAAKLSLAKRLQGLLILAVYMIGRLFQKNTRQYRNLPG